MPMISVYVCCAALLASIVFSVVEIIRYSKRRKIAIDADVRKQYKGIIISFSVLLVLQLVGFVTALLYVLSALSA